jgi:hypothetical protein
MAQKLVNPWYPRLHELYHQTPFRPFIIRMAGGRSVTVRSPLRIMFAPTYRRIHVATRSEIADQIDVKDVVGVVEAPLAQARRSRK